MFLAFSYLVVSSPDFGQGWWLAAWVRGYHGCFENDSWWLMWWVPLCPFFPPPSHVKAWISWSMLQIRASLSLATAGCWRPGSHVCYFHLHATRRAFAPSVCSSDPEALTDGFHRDRSWCHHKHADCLGQGQPCQSLAGLVVYRSDSFASWLGDFEVETLAFSPALTWVSKESFSTNHKQHKEPFMENGG